MDAFIEEWIRENRPRYVAELAEAVETLARVKPEYERVVEEFDTAYPTKIVAEYDTLIKLWDAVPGTRGLHNRWDELSSIASAYREDTEAYRNENGDLPYEEIMTQLDPEFVNLYTLATNSNKVVEYLKDAKSKIIVRYYRTHRGLVDMREVLYSQVSDLNRQIESLHEKINQSKELARTLYEYHATPFIPSPTTPISTNRRVANDDET
jgi:hypothetical protein